MIENIKLSFRGIFSHKLRSILTMLGIIIGIAAIIAIVSTIQGTNEQIKENLIGTGVNNVEVTVTQGGFDYEFYDGNPESLKPISNDQIKELKKIKAVKEMSLYTKRQVYDNVYHLKNTLSGGMLYGIDDTYLQTTSQTIKTGRGFSKNDLDNYDKVCIIDSDCEKNLFNGESAIGKTIEIKKEPFVVVGIASQKKVFEPSINSIEDYYTYNENVSGKIYVPITTWPVLYQYDEPENVVFKASTPEDMAKIGKKAEKILNANLESDADIKYKAVDVLKEAKKIQQLTKSTNTMLIWIAAISLLVGGIGVMNIMLVSVTERTNEIGLKKAIGAPKKSIMIQFLTEAIVLTSVGGLIGVIIGILLAFIISKLNGTPVAINVLASIGAVFFSMVIGIIFGILPSRKAASLNPIEALRYE